MKNKLKVLFYKLRSQLIGWTTSINLIFKFLLAAFFAGLSFLICSKFKALPENTADILLSNIFTLIGFALSFYILLFSLLSFGSGVLSAKLIKSLY